MTVGVGAEVHTRSLLPFRVALGIFLCMNAVYFFAYFQRIGVPGTIFDELQRDFAASAGAITLLGGLYLYVYGGMQVLVGVLADRFGAAWVLLAGGILLALGSLLFPLAQEIGWLYAARVLVGLGASLIFISIVKSLDEYFAPQHFVLLIGLTLFIGGAGGLTATYPFERAVTAFGWRGALLGAGVLCALMVGVFLLVFRRAVAATPAATVTPRAGILRVLRNWQVLPLVLAQPAHFAIYYLLQATIGKKFLTDYCHLPSALAAGFPCVMMLITMVLALGSGFISRLLGQRRKPIMFAGIACALAACVLLLVGLATGQGNGWFFGCYVLLACSTMTSPISNTLMKELSPPQTVGTAIGVLNGACYLIVAVLTSLSGLVLDHFHAQATVTATAVIYPPAAYATLFALCLLISLGTLISACFVKESHGMGVYEGEKGEVPAPPTPNPLHSTGV